MYENNNVYIIVYNSNVLMLTIIAYNNVYTFVCRIYEYELRINYNIVYNSMYVYNNVYNVVYRTYEL